jgi:hypothetical protein
MTGRGGKTGFRRRPAQSRVSNNESARIWPQDGRFEGRRRDAEEKSRLRALLTMPSRWEGGRILPEETLAPGGWLRAPFPAEGWTSFPRAASGRADNTRPVARVVKQRQA